MFKQKKLVLQTCQQDTTIYSLKTTAEEVCGGYGTPNSPTVQLFASRKDNKWTEKVRGKQLAKAVDDGNGIDVTFKEGLKFRLDYCQANELQILLKELEDQYRFKTKTKKVAIK